MARPDRAPLGKAGLVVQLHRGPPVRQSGKDTPPSPAPQARRHNGPAGLRTTRPTQTTAPAEAGAVAAERTRMMDSLIVFLGMFAGLVIGAFLRFGLKAPHVFFRAAKVCLYSIWMRLVIERELRKIHDEANHEADSNRDGHAKGD